MAMSKAGLAGFLFLRAQPAREDNQDPFGGSGADVLKAFLLAAGHGTRLRPLTDTMPKCLLPVRGVPLLQIWLENCCRFGIDEVLINIHAHADLVQSFVRSHSGSSPKVKVVREAKLLGSAGTLLANRTWVDSEACFCVFYADVLNDVDLGAMLQLHRARKPAATLGVCRVPDPARCGIVEVREDGIIHNFVEKPEHPNNDLAFAGLLVGTPALLDAIPRKRPVDIGFDVLPLLAGKMLAYSISDYLIDIGTMENYQNAQATWPGFPGGLAR
jgi:mannose-1-phosphate guanylyltransferase